MANIDNIEQRSTHKVKDSSGDVVAEGNLDYIGERISTFTVYGTFNKPRLTGTLRIESKVNYEEVYSAKVVRLEDQRIILDNLRNISEDLRQDLKVDYRGKIHLEYQEKINGETVKQVVEGRTENISGGGIGFVSEEKLEVGQILSLKAQIPDLFFEIKAEILRRETFGRLYRYGCKFCDISKIEESAIRKLVYKLQIDNRNYLRAKDEFAK